jgi:hypothetical protein
MSAYLGIEKTVVYPGDRPGTDAGTAPAGGSPKEGKAMRRSTWGCSARLAFALAAGGVMTAQFRHVGSPDRATRPVTNLTFTSTRPFVIL